MNSPKTQTSESPATSNGQPAASGRQGTKIGFIGRLGPVVWLIAIGVVVLSAVGVFAVTRMLIRSPYTGPTAVAKKERLKVTIVERGSLESAENSDITIRVKAGAKGSTSASIIRWVIPDGSVVKAGDRIVELDDSGFQDTLKTQRNTVNSKFSEWVTAKHALDIQMIENESNIKTAEVKLIQADLELKSYAGYTAAAKMARLATQSQVRKYLREEFERDVRKESAAAGDKFTCTYLQEVNDLEGKIENARSDRESWLDRAAWSTRMVKKGFYSLSQADADQSRLASMEISLRMAEGSLDIYRKFITEQKLTAKWNDMKEAERGVKKAEVTAKSLLVQKQADDSAKKAIYEQEMDRLNDQLKDELFYKIDAPQDGLVVYFMPEQSRFGSGSQQSIVAQGEPVREGQKLIRIPNLRKMLVNVKVHEAMLSKVKPEKIRETHYSDILRFSSTFGSRDPFDLTFAYRAFEEIRPSYKDKEQVVTRQGQQALIRVESFPGKQYRGRVKSKATVPSQADFLSSDVKLFQTMVSIDDLEPETMLNPGLSAEVTILADETHEPVLIIPIQSILGNVSMGAKRKVFVLDDGGYPIEREIEVGLSSDKYAEVRSGLQEGDKVVLSPKSLLPEKTDLKAGIPGQKRGAEFEEEGKKTKKMDGVGKKDQGSFKGK